MAKVHPVLIYGTGFFIAYQQAISSIRKEVTFVKEEKKDVISYRKSCNAEGTGLSHYILMGSQAK